MSVFKSAVNPSSEQFKKNYKEMEALCKKLEEQFHKSLFQGSEKHIEKAKSQGKFLARERIELLLDQDSFFLELLPLIGMEGEGFGIGGTSVAGIGMVSNRLCMVISNVGTHKGGHSITQLYKKQYA